MLAWMRTPREAREVEWARAVVEAVLQEYAVEWGK